MGKTPVAKKSKTNPDWTRFSSSRNWPGSNLLICLRYMAIQIEGLDGLDELDLIWRYVPA